MPSRIIRESCRTSATLFQLSHGAERMFWRLTTVADDHGRFEADPRVLLAECFPLWAGRIKVAEVQRWYQEMERCGLVTSYVVNGKPLGFFTTWTRHQRVRSSHSKYPAPTEDTPVSEHVPAPRRGHPPQPAASRGEAPQPAAGRGQSPPSAPESMSPGGMGFGAGGMGYGAGGMEKDRPPRAQGARYSPAFDKFWTDYPKKVAKDDAWKAWGQKECEADADAVITGLCKQREYLLQGGLKYVPHPGTWLRAGRWKDEPPPPAATLTLVTPRTLASMPAFERFINRERQDTTP
jgi:hypothetical protein